MKLSKFEIDLLIGMITEKYEETYLEYKEFNNSATFSRLLDIELLRKKIIEMLGETK